MRKAYIFLAALAAAVLCGTLSARADDVTFKVNANTGFWTSANPANTWASKWESTQDNPHIIIAHVSGANNMNFYDGENIQFFNSVGANTTGANTNYSISVSTGYFIKAVSFDFDCSNDEGVIVILNDGDPVESLSQGDTQHVEVTDIEETSVSFNVATINGATTFARTTNFVLTLAQQSNLAVAEAEFMEVLHKYEVYEEDDFQVGTAPGLYDEAARDAFFAALQAAHGIDDIPVDEITEQLFKQLGDNLISTFDALVASRNLTYTLPEGYKYFRVRAAMIYADEEGQDVNKYLAAERSGDKFAGRWRSLYADDPLLEIQTLWSITPNVNNFDMVSAYCKGRFNNIATSTAATLSTESDNMMAFDPVYTDTDEGITYLNIRVSAQEADKGLYLHQGGHSNGAGVEGNIVGWYTSWSYVDGPRATEWVLEPVSDEEAAAIIEAGTAAVQREQFEDDFAQLGLDANLTLAAAQADMTATDLITSAEQLSSPWTEESEGSIEALIDGDPTTFWHSAWSGGNVEPMTHYLQVALNEPTHELVRIKMTRRQATNDHITTWVVAGSNDAEAEDEAWEYIALLTTPYGSNTETVTTRGFHTKDYKYLRLYIAETTTGRGYGHAAELQLQALTVTPGSQYAALQDAADAVTAKLEELEFIPVDEITEEQGAELQSAYDGLRSLYVDPSDLRAVIAKAEALAEGIVVGTQPGYWKDNTLATNLQTLVGQAKAYDEAASYTVAKSKEFVDKLNEAMEPVLSAAIGIKTGKWYNIRFGSKETFEENGWDLEAGAAVMSSGEDEDPYEIDEALWDKIVTVAKYNVDEASGSHFVVPVAAEDVRLNSNIFVDDKADIEDAGMALFRFIAVGDSAYMIQNKATGLFIRTGVTGASVLDIHPSLFNVRAIGFGQNVIVATDLKGADNNYLHIQRSYNLLVTWNADTPGSRSGLYLDEVADVAADYKGETFQMNIRDGEIYTFCYPVNLALGEDNVGQMYTVNSAADGKITLANIDKAFAGRPFIYISGDTESYDAEAEAEPAPFVHGYEVVAEPNTYHALKGTFEKIMPGAGFLVVNEGKRNSFTVSHAIMENSTVGAHQAYIEQTGEASGEIEVIYSDEPDGIQKALANVSRNGSVYTLDGRLISRNGNLNTARRNGPGIYIINGTKVVVKM